MLHLGLVVRPVNDRPLYSVACMNIRDGTIDNSRPITFTCVHS